MELLCTKEIEIKKSKFIGYLYKIDDASDAEKAIEFLKQEHKKARHIPYAYKVGAHAKKTDDKEPSGTAGVPIFNAVERSKMDGILVAVVRYFGGTKLGAGPLLRAYSACANEVIKNI